MTIEINGVPGSNAVTVAIKANGQCSRAEAEMSEQITQAIYQTLTDKSQPGFKCAAAFGGTMLRPA
jgi:hypothetical protein